MAIITAVVYNHYPVPQVVTPIPLEIVVCNQIWYSQYLLVPLVLSTSLSNLETRLITIVLHLVTPYQSVIKCMWVQLVVLTAEFALKRYILLKSFLTIDYSTSKEMLKKMFLMAVLLIGGKVYAQQLQQLGDENPTSKQQLCV